MEFEKEAEMKAAYKQADGLKLNGMRLLTDVERGRTVKGWTPKKLGAGLGKKRIGRAAIPRPIQPTRNNARPRDSQSSFRGGLGPRSSTGTSNGPPSRPSSSYGGDRRPPPAAPERRSYHDRDSDRIDDRRNDRRRDDVRRDDSRRDDHRRYDRNDRRDRDRRGDRFL